MNSQTPFAITLQPQSSRAHHTGSWRTSEPIYQDRTAPCHCACPIGQNVREWLALAQEGNDQAAWQTIMDHSPFPAIQGRVCYHPCESKCNRESMDGSVQVHSVERFLGDKAIAEGWRPFALAAATGKRVLILGAGPAGLACAYHLARRGHSVAVYDEFTLAGGMMRYGIPEYRLPRDVMDAEIKRIADLGVQIITGKRIDDVAQTMTAGKFDAAFIATGSHLSKSAGLADKGRTRIIGAIEFLRAVTAGTDVGQLGNKVIVYGGGNTAMDSARTALRLGAKEVTIVYRRDRRHMPAHAMEVNDALAEGVKLILLRTIKAVTDEGLTLEAMTIGADQKAVPTGTFETMPADTVIVALGQDADTACLQSLTGVKRKKDGTVAVDREFRTGEPKVFAGGDVINSDRTLTTAVGHGKFAALQIDAYLIGKILPPVEDGYVMTPADLNTFYYSPARASVQPQRTPADRVKDFGEAVGGLTQQQARAEAQRCLACGTCIRCSTCFSVCPDSAIRQKPDGSYEIDPLYCKGCGICVEECPSGAMQFRTK